MAGNSFGTLLTLTTFGESHGMAIGGILDGFPAGIAIDEDFIKGEILDRYKDGVFLIVGHGVAFKCFIRGVLGSDARMTHKLGMDNLSMTRLTYSDRDGWSLDWMNRPLIPKKV